jgi:methyl-accepting chemotaxis protein
MLLRDRWRSPSDQRRAGQLMIAVGVLGAVVVVFGTIVGWIFVGQIATASEDSVEVTAQTFDAIDDTIDLAEEAIDSTVGAVDALAGTLVTLSSTFQSGADAIDDVAALADTIGPSLSDAGATVRSLERVGDQIDTALGTLSRLPIGPDYDPESGLGDTFGRLAVTLESLPGELAATSDSLSEFTSNADDLRADIDRLAVSVGAIAGDLGDSSALVDQYRTSVADARTLAVATTDDVDLSVGLMRILLVMGGVLLLLGQVVPLWLGRSLLDELDRLEPLDRLDQDLPDQDEDRAPSGS